MNEKIIKIPIRSIERSYGKDCLDSAGDDIVFCLAQVEEYPGQLSFSFGIDSSHENPWYHFLIYKGVPASEYQFKDLLRKIRELKLEVEIVENT